jgi:hypothetical protein
MCHHGVRRQSASGDGALARLCGHPIPDAVLPFGCHRPNSPLRMGLVVPSRCTPPNGASKIFTGNFLILVKGWL